MSPDPRAPVIIGIGEVTYRDGDIVDPVDLAAEAALAACKDAGVDIASRIDTVAVPGILLIGRDNPAHRIADATGLASGRRISCPVGGNTPQYLVGKLGAQIAKGKADAVLVTGAEAGKSAVRARQTERWPDVGAASGTDASLGDDRPGLSNIENAAGLHSPPQVYPIFESAMAYRQGRTLNEQREWLGRLMAPFTAEAARHPDHAWFPVERQPSDLSEVTPSNRLINEPYTKLLNSILTVDMAAAFIIVAAELADSLGVSKDRRVYSWASADCNDIYFPAQRPALYRSDGIRAAGAAVLEAADIGIDDVAFLDFYSCFPAAVEAAIDAFGLDPGDARGFTVTGGLPYFGGPGNNYVSHSIVEMVRRCRSEPDKIGLTTGLGWYITKHSVGLWSATPPRRWQAPDLSAEQARIDAGALEVVPAREASGTAVVDGYTIRHDRDTGPTSVPVFARSAEGKRIVARNDDPDTAAVLSGGMLVGESIVIRPGEDCARFELS